MKLTGQCFEAFKQYWKDKNIAFSILDSKIEIIQPPFQNALFIEFFDSQDIRIWVSYNDFTKRMFDVYIDDERLLGAYLTREEALDAGIEKANYLYNNLGENNKI